jgi:uncharacterized membrane protein
VVSKKRRRRQIARASAQRRQQRRTLREMRRRRWQAVLTVVLVIVAVAGLAAWIYLDTRKNSTHAGAGVLTGAHYAGLASPGASTSEGVR